MVTGTHLAYQASGMTNVAAAATPTVIGAALTTPVSMQALVGVIVTAAVHANAANGQCVNGILELTSPDFNLVPCQLPLEVVQVSAIGAGAVAIHTPKVYPLTFPCSGNVRITGTATLNSAVTGGADIQFTLVENVAN